MKSIHQIYDSQAAAVYLTLSPHSVRKYVQRGILRPLRSIGRAYIFSREELDRFRNSRRSAGRPPQKK